MTQTLQTNFCFSTPGEPACNLVLIGQAVSEEMSFENVDMQTIQKMDDGPLHILKALLEPLALVS